MSGPGSSVFWEAREKHDEPRQHTRLALYLLLGTAVLLLGSNWPVMVMALDTVSPLWHATIRIAGAVVAVTVMGFFSGNLVVPPRRDVPLILSTAIVRLAGVMVLVFIALTLVPAGRASVLVWTSALWTVPIAAVFLGDTMTRQKWTGLAIGLVGVFVISELWNNNWDDRDVIVGTALLLVAALCNASTSVHIRHHQWSIDPLQAMPWQLLVALVPVGSLALIVDGLPHYDWTWALTANFAYQSIVVSGVAFWAQMIVLRRLSPVSVNLTMMGVPVVGVVSSAIALNEGVSAPLAIGMALVLSGVAVNLLWEPSTGAAGEEARPIEAEVPPTEMHDGTLP
jgi:drug/metabolite transporter (DMT)-like permease